MDNKTSTPDGFDTLPNAAFISVSKAAGVLGVSRGTYYRWVKSAKVPAPVRVGDNTSRVSVGQLRKVISALLAEV